MGCWLEYMVIFEVQVLVVKVWEVWSDFEVMFCWMCWIELVMFLEDFDFIDWILVVQGFCFSWKVWIIQWVEV